MRKITVFAVAAIVATALFTSCPNSSTTTTTDSGLTGISSVSYGSSTTPISSDAQFAHSVKSLVAMSVPSPSFKASKALKRSLDGNLSNDYVTFSGIDAFMKAGCKGTVTAKGSKTLSSSSGATLSYDFSASGTLSHDLKLDSSYDIDGDGTAEDIPTLVYDAITDTQPTSPYLSNNTLSLKAGLTGSATLSGLTGTTTATDGSTSVKLTLDKAVFSIDGLSLGLGLSNASLSTGSSGLTGSGTFTLAAGATYNLRCVLSSSNADIAGGKIHIATTFNKSVTLQVADLVALVSNVESATTSSAKEDLIMTFLSDNSLTSSDVSFTVTVWDNSNTEVYSKTFTLDAFQTLISKS